MSHAVGDVLPLAIGVAISPVPIIAIVLMLGTPRARSNGPAFALGWLVGLAAVGAIVLLAAGEETDDAPGQPTAWQSALRLGIGALFLLLAARTWRTRPKPGEEAQMPRWMQAIDTFTVGKSLGMGGVLSGLNPKNLALTIAAATTIAQSNISGGEQAGALTVFVLLASLTILAPLGIYFAMGARAEVILDGIKGFMASHNAAIMSVVLVILGMKLIGDAISGFGS